MPSPLAPSSPDSERPFTVLFGHQSVGRDVLAGLAEERYERICSAPLETSVAAHPSPILVRTFAVGANGDWASKIEHFAAECLAHADAVDLALFKFCYVDVTAQTPVERVFETYSAAMERLSARYPRTRFGHVTAPLRTEQAGWRATIKRLAGRAPGGASDNAARERFNQLMRKRYAGGGLLFDLAVLETGDPSRPTRGARAPSLARSYTNDGGHLNAQGRRIAARAFAQFLESARTSRCSTL